MVLNHQLSCCGSGWTTAAGMISIRLREISELLLRLALLRRWDHPVVVETLSLIDISVTLMLFILSLTRIIHWAVSSAMWWNGCTDQIKSSPSLLASKRWKKTSLIQLFKSTTKCRNNSVQLLQRLTTLSTCVISQKCSKACPKPTQEPWHKRTHLSNYGLTNAYVSSKIV